MLWSQSWEDLSLSLSKETRLIIDKDLARIPVLCLGQSLRKFVICLQGLFVSKVPSFEL